MGVVDEIVHWVSRHAGKWWSEPISVTLKRVSEESVRKLDDGGESLDRLQELLSSPKSENNE